ncbi:MAG: hypothetical protein M4579_007531, partial [Chaenotheca gracillima]
ESRQEITTIVIEGPVKENYFQGPYAGSVREPDLGVRVVSPDSSSKLRVIIVDVKETPQYRSPCRDLTDDELRKLDLSKDRAIDDTDIQLPVPEHPSRPINVGGFRRVGKMAATLEMWDRHPSTNEARIRGDRKVATISHPSISYSLRDTDEKSQMFIHPTNSAEGRPPPLDLKWSHLDPRLSDDEIDIQWEALRSRMRLAWRDLALSRYRSELQRLSTPEK